MVGDYQIDVELSNESGIVGTGSRQVVLEHIIESPFETLSYTEAVEVLADRDIQDAGVWQGMGI